MYVSLGSSAKFSYFCTCYSNSYNYGRIHTKKHRFRTHRLEGRFHAEADEKSMKVLFLDPGLLLAVLQLEGGMKSIWLFMREKKLTEAFRCSLENFGSFDYIDKQDDDAIRHVTILPLYALSLLRSR